MRKSTGSPLPKSRACCSCQRPDLIDEARSSARFLSAAGLSAFFVEDVSYGQGAGLVRHPPLLQHLHQPPLPLVHDEHHCLLLSRAIYGLS